jgi:hypothetical protein
MTFPAFHRPGPAPRACPSPRMGLGARVLAWAILGLLALGCMRPALRPERLDGASLLEHIDANFRPIERIEVQWSVLLEAPGLSPTPFRMDVDWSAEGAQLVLRTPFGGELATLSCDADGGLDARGGSRLQRTLERALQDAGEGSLAAWLQAGAAALFSHSERPGFRIEVRDERLAPLLALIEPQIPGGWLQAGRCDRAALGPWLWGEWRPSAGASWNPAALSLSAGDSLWTVDARRGLVEEARLGGLELRAGDWTRQRKVWLPARIEVLDREARRRLVLERRGLRLNRPLEEEPR